ncbi:hypothetical protein TSOC_009406 [Tetrabaena socialis]|uniref:Uncharacterized protein n=1 Tax=Tetrabaena socialis TaxID=47790 RepID=A0A2J7ZVY1_9CHLO|nr:hypothetical protein TSOC_009406 [Tetrabaena socialis]|eukprot:PNH04441.1 hypothetical protein TSOC_009406 [Tetrabaena socialis]
MLTSALAETLGSFVFVTVILATTTKGALETLAPLLIGLALAVAIYVCSKASLGALNPVVALVMYLRGDINAVTTAVYIIGEVIGALLAFAWWKVTMS